MAGITEPLPLVFKSDEVMPLIARPVVVALVPVALLKEKFWRVVEPITNRSPAELMVEVAVPPILN